MKKIDYLSTLFVGIDVSSKTNTVFAMDFNCNSLLTCVVTNNQPGADELVASLLKIIYSDKFKLVIIALESTSFYSTHIATYLSDNPQLKLFSAQVYCLNPKIVANYRKSFIGLSKTDPKDAYIIADFVRVGRITQEPLARFAVSGAPASDKAQAAHHRVYNPRENIYDFKYVFEVLGTCSC